MNILDIFGALIGGLIFAACIAATIVLVADKDAPSGSIKFGVVSGAVTLGFVGFAIMEASFGWGLLS